MSKTSDLIGLGVPSQVASVLATNTISSLTSGSVSNGLTATGTTITDALPLVSIINVITTTPASSGVKLPNIDPGGEITVLNNGAAVLNLFPPDALGTLNGGTAGAAVTVAAGAGNSATRLSATDWLVTVFAKET